MTIPDVGDSAGISPHIRYASYRFNGRCLLELTLHGSHSRDSDTNGKMPRRMLASPGDRPAVSCRMKRSMTPSKSKP